MDRLLLGAVLLGNLADCLAETVPVLLAPPTEVKFESVDYKNILRWTPPTTTASLHYNIQWKIYGEPQWLDVHGCQGIQKLHCDLSGVTSEPREWYYARVQASSLPANRSAWALSPRFSPRWDTKISSPSLRLNATEQGIVVRVRQKKQLSKKMHLVYKIFVTHSGGDEEVHVIECSKMILREIKPQVEYCFQVQTTIPSQFKSSSRSPLKCVTAL